MTSKRERNNKPILRPGITHPDLWYPKRPSKAEWERIRQAVLKRDDWTCIFCGHRATKYMNIHHLEDSASCDPNDLAPLCVACHAVSHIGHSLMYNSIEIWESTISQVDIVHWTRLGIKEGLSLIDIKARLPISSGPYPADSTEYANNLIRTMGNAPRAYLAEPLCAVFMKLERWQIE